MNDIEGAQPRCDGLRRAHPGHPRRLAMPRLRMVARAGGAHPDTEAVRQARDPRWQSDIASRVSRMNSRPNTAG